MRPELVIQDFGGHHNGDMNRTRSRLIKGASWKRQRIIAVIPAGQMIPAKVALSHWGLAFPPNNGVVRILAQGMEVGDAYSTAIEQIIAHPELSQWEYLLSVEHDNTPPADGVLQLVAQMEAHPEFSVISGLYYTRGEGGVAQIWGDARDPVMNFRPQLPVAGQLVECNGTGMGFAVWRLAMFNDSRLRRPWFKTLAGREGVSTQDLYFWGDARKYGYRCAVDCACLVGHYDVDTDICW
jgi:hypothetical protein